MTRVNAFKIARVDNDAWLFDNDPSCSVFGYVPGQIVHLPEYAFTYRRPEVGDHVVVWPHGLITTCAAASFEKDFTHVSGTVYETPREALFQRGMLRPEYREARRKEQEERLRKPRYTPEDLERIQRENDASAERARATGSPVVRRIVMGTLPAPTGFVQPRDPVPIILPVLKSILP